MHVNQRIVLCSLLSFLLITSFGRAVLSSPVAYRMVDLGVPDGLASWEACSINNSGVVVGNGTTPFVWSQATGFVKLSVKEGWHADQVTSISEKGLIAGIMADEYWQRHIVVWDCNGDFNVLTDADPLAFPSVINDEGIIAGGNADGPRVWYPDGSSRLITGPTNGNACDINNNGQAVGAFGWKDEYPKAFIWSQADGLKMLSPLDGVGHCQPIAINDNGQVVGWSDSADNTRQSVLWETDGSVHVLSIDPRGINNCGQICGWGAGRNAVIQNPDGDIVILPGFDGSIYTDALAINDNGWVVGYSTSGSQRRAVLWQPVPEPSSLFAVVTGISVLLGIRRLTR